MYILLAMDVLAPNHLLHILYSINTYNIMWTTRLLVQKWALHWTPGHQASTCCSNLLPSKALGFPQGNSCSSSSTGDCPRRDNQSSPSGNRTKRIRGMAAGPSHLITWSPHDWWSGEGGSGTLSGSQPLSTPPLSPVWDVGRPPWIIWPQLQDEPGSPLAACSDQRTDQEGTGISL